MLMSLGYLLAQAGDNRSSFQAFREALNLDPADADIHLGLGNNLWALGNLEGAVAYYRRALELAPEHFFAHYNLATVSAGLGRVDQAVKHYRMALSVAGKGSDPGALQRVRAYLSAHGSE